MLVCIKCARILTDSNSLSCCSYLKPDKQKKSKYKTKVKPKTLNPEF